MACSHCHSNSVFTIPAEIRLYRDRQRMLSHPPMNPNPEVRICAECGWAEFVVPVTWLAAGWIRRPQQKRPNLRLLRNSLI